MEIIKDFPPNIAQIDKKLNVRAMKNVVFTYGESLYNPLGDPISPDLMAHEETHAKQQKNYGVGDWWTRYLEDPGFRLTQELEAYQEQFKAVQGNSRAWRRLFLTRISQDLASELYGHIINAKTAKELINEYR